MSITPRFYRWVQRYAPEMEKRLRWYWQTLPIFARGMDETYVKVNGRQGVSVPGRRQPGPHSILSLPPVVTAKLHTGFWCQILNNVKKRQIPRFINTDKAPPMVARLFSAQTRGRPVPV